jgi:hypothetical protein
VAQIVVDARAKSFDVAEREPGMLGALRGLVRRRHRVVHALECAIIVLQATLAPYVHRLLSAPANRGARPCSPARRSRYDARGARKEHWK